MSEQEDSVLSGVSISTGVIPFPSLDSSLLRQALEGSSSPSPEPMKRPSTSSPAQPESYRDSPSLKATSDNISTLPFPTNLPISNDGSRSPSPEPGMKDSMSNSAAEGSHITASSSKLTSSDKLSALPSSNNSFGPNVARNIRSPTFSTLANIKRGYRRSLDATISLPSFSLAEPVDSRSETNSNSGIFQRHPTPENASAGKETPKQRVSFENDRASMPSVRQALSRLPRGSDPQSTSPVLRPSSFIEHRDVDISSNVQELGSRSQSPTRSRATSPLRMFQHWSSGLRGHRVPVEEPFVPVDPFKAHTHIPFCCFPGHVHDLESGEGSAFSGPYDCDDLIPTTSIKAFFGNAQLFIIGTLPRKLYLNFLLYLPAVYFSRVARIFEDAEVSKPDIQRMIGTLGRGPGMMSTQAGNGGMATGTWEPNILAQSTPVHIPMSTFSPPAATGTLPPRGSPQLGTISPVASMIHMPLPFPDEWAPPFVSPALIRFKHSWEAFIDSLLREWKTLNVVSAVLASTILTTFQIPAAEADPVTRTAALLSLICALMSLTYGCMYIVRFGMMKNMFHACRWAEEAQRTNTFILWNVWVLLAMPAIWMAWSMLLFIATILSFAWRTGSVSDPVSGPPPLGTQAALALRIVITCVLLLGLVYLALIIRTFQKYGSHVDPTRELLFMGTRNTTPQGGETRGRGSTTEGHGGATGGEKKMRARDIDAAMERRGRQRERSVSTTNIRRREEDVEQRQYGGQPSVGDSGKKDVGRSPKRVVGLGFGSRVQLGHGSGELKELPELEMDLKIDGLP